jgi:hypothetical protein
MFFQILQVDFCVLYPYFWLFFRNQPGFPEGTADLSPCAGGFCRKNGCPDAPDMVE